MRRAFILGKRTEHGERDLVRDICVVYPSVGNNIYTQNQIVMHEKQIGKACSAGRMIAVVMRVEQIFKHYTKGVFQNNAESSRQSCRT